MAGLEQMFRKNNKTEKQKYITARKMDDYQMIAAYSILRQFTSQE